MIPLGHDRAIFIEDCAFNISVANLIDGDGGCACRQACTIFGSEAGNHGTETGNVYRSGGPFEFYQNHLEGGRLAFTHNWISTFVAGARSYGVIIATRTIPSWYSLIFGSGFRATPGGKPTGQMCGRKQPDLWFSHRDPSGGNGSNHVGDKRRLRTTNGEPTQSNVRGGTASSIDSNT